MKVNIGIHFLNRLFISLIFSAFVVATLPGCKSLHADDNLPIAIDTLFTDQISIRALHVQGGRLWYGGDKGRYGFVDISSKERRESTAVPDSITGEFRSIASGGSSVFLLNAGSPARLIEVLPDLSREIVYSENHPDAFYDSMRFTSVKHGIALGDPVNGCFSILQTWDGGTSWSKIPCQDQFANLEGEAAFAASNGNIATVGDDIWLFTGGKSSRVLKSSNRGKTWQAYPTPMVSGKTMTGTFAGDFYDSLNGMIVGGDYENQKNNFGNIAITSDGGVTWTLVSEGVGFGYASGVKYIPGSGAKRAVAVGPSGLFYTSDAGKSWTVLHRDPDFHTIVFADENIAYAAGKGKVVRLTFQEIR